MRLTDKYRLRPTKSQRRQLEQALELCRFVYNETLATRKHAYEQRGETLCYYQTAKLLPFWRADKPDLARVHSQVLQNAMIRVDLAFQAFFRRVKAGEKPGYPRFKSFGCYDSLTYPRYGNGVKLDGDRLRLSKIGSVQVRLHRPIEGEIKTVTIQRSADKWYACFSCGVDKQALEPTPNVVEVGLGLKTFAVMSDGTHIQRQRWMWRNNFAHQASRKLVNANQLIALEKLDIQTMMRDGKRVINRNIADAAWGQFVQHTTYKAESAGRSVVLVNARGATQACSGCGQAVPKDLSVRVHDCPHCGLKIDRDLNAALNILARGLARIRPRPVEAPGFSRGE